MNDPGPAGLVDAVLFRPVRGGNAFEDTVARLLQTIRLGMVEPGGALPPERELATRFSVSRDTVREAIKSLSDAGYLVSRRGRYGGTFVSDPVPEREVPDAAPPPQAEIDDVLGLRDILEVGAARAAAARELGAADRELLADNRTHVNELLDGIPLLARNIAHSNEQHEAIVVAILTGSPDRAGDAMSEHLAGSAALLRAFLG